jgi:23S rRNA (adenine2503-C2)-methyltransferase
MSQENKQMLYELSDDNWLEFLDQNGFKKFRFKQINNMLYENFEDIEENTTLPKDLKETLLKNFSKSLKVETVQKSIDKTIKILFTTMNEQKSIEQIETVIMDYGDRFTACISSQAGCAMGCVFCATGQSGFNRHLDMGEIVEQVIQANKVCLEENGKPITNIVFMGMGEPLANADVVYRSIKSIHDKLNISARKITVSTVGFLPGMRKMLDWEIPVTLAVSLHAPNDKLRTEIVPVNKLYDIDAILEAASDYAEKFGRRVTFEYVGLASTTSSDTAHELGTLLSSYDGKGGAHLNLIPYNQTSFMQNDVDPAKLIRFCEIVSEYGVNATLRTNKGNDIDAACGQLKERVSLESKDSNE